MERMSIGGQKERRMFLTLFQLKSGLLSMERFFFATYALLLNWLFLPESDEV